MRRYEYNIKTDLSETRCGFDLKWFKIRSLESFCEAGNKSLSTKKIPVYFWTL